MRYDPVWWMPTQHSDLGFDQHERGSKVFEMCPFHF